MKYQLNLRFLMIIFLGLLLIKNDLFAQASIEVKFDHLLNLLESKNNVVKASQLQKEAAEKREGSLLRSFIPSIEVYGKQESLKDEFSDQKSQKTIAADLKMNIFNGGRDQIESEIRDLTSQSRQAQTQRITSEQLLEARTLFWEILFTKKQIDLLQSVILLNSQIMKAANNRIRTGVATESDRFEFEIKSIDLKQNLSDAKLALKTLNRNLINVLGFDENTQIKINGDLEHTHEVENILKYESGDLEYLFKELELEQKTTHLKAKNLDKVWWPKLDAFAGYAEYDPKSDSKVDNSKLTKSETTLGLQLTMALSDGIEASNESAALIKEAAAFNELNKLQRKKVDIDLNSYLEQIKNLHDQVHDADSNVSLVEKYYKITQSEYNRGVKNSPDVLGASEKLFDIKLKRIQIVRDFQILKAKFLSKIGK